MFKVEIGGREYDAEVSFYTALVYEAEFQSDLLKDLFGVQDASPALTMDGGEVVSVDFTRTNWLAAMKALWAAIKTADESASSYRAWLKASKGANMWLAYELLAAEATDCFFRAGAAEEDAPKKKQR